MKRLALILVVCMGLAGSVIAVEIAGLVSGATGVAATISTWDEGGTPSAFQVCTNAPVEIGSTGVYYIELTAAELNHDFGVLRITCNEAEAVVIPLNMELFGIDADASTGTWESDQFTSISITFFPGEGDNTVTVNVVDSLNGGIASAIVTVKNNAQTEALGRAVTDANGQATFGLYNGTYKVILSDYGRHTFTVPETLTVSGTTSDTYIGATFSPDLPTTANVCHIYGWLYESDGSPASGQTVSASIRPEDRPVMYDSDGDGDIDGDDNAIMYVSTAMTDTTDSNGQFDLYLTYSAVMLRIRDDAASKYVMTVENSAMTHEFSAPSTDTAKLGILSLTER